MKVGNCPFAQEHGVGICNRPCDAQVGLKEVFLTSRFEKQTESPELQEVFLGPRNQEQPEPVGMGTLHLHLEEVKKADSPQGIPILHLKNKLEKYCREWMQ